MCKLYIVKQETALQLPHIQLQYWHVVSQGADGGLRFIEYVEYLVDNEFVPPNGRG